jgi:hypothetical protein
MMMFVDFLMGARAFCRGALGAGFVDVMRLSFRVGCVDEVGRLVGGGAVEVLEDQAVGVGGDDDG